MGDVSSFSVADDAVEMLNMVFSVTVGIFVRFPIGDMMGSCTLIAQVAGSILD